MCSLKSTHYFFFYFIFVRLSTVFFRGSLTCLNQLNAAHGLMFGVAYWFLFFWKKCKEIEFGLLWFLMKLYALSPSPYIPHCSFLPICDFRRLLVCKSELDFNIMGNDQELIQSPCLKNPIGKWTYTCRQHLKLTNTREKPSGRLFPNTWPKDNSK